MLKINAFFTAISIGLGGYVATACAGPWLSMGGAEQPYATFATKSDIELLAAYGFIQAPLLAWPIPWENIGPLLLSPRSKEKLPQAPPYVQQIYFRVLSQYQQATQTPLQGSAYTSGGYRINPFRTFEFQPRSPVDTGFEVEQQGIDWAGKLAINYGQYKDLTEPVHLDNTYLYGFFGNWGVGVDKMPRWWGPGYSESMILSANAPPLPALTIQRMRADPIDWLPWIGPWSFTTSLSVGGSDAPIANPLIWLANLSFRPLESLQFSISRAAFFAGETRPLNAMMLKNLLTVNDNCSPEREGAYYCNKYSPGTEHWELSATWNLFNQWGIPASLYLQTIFNDRVPYTSAPWLYKLSPILPPVPGRTAFLTGASTWFPFKQGLLRLYTEFEYTYQYVYFFWGEFARNIYGYSQYPYMYHGKLLGSSLGGETSSYTIGGIFSELNGNSDTIMARFLQLNGLGARGGVGYPFLKKDVVWLSIGRTITLPKSLGQLSGQLAYLKALSGATVKNTPIRAKSSSINLTSSPSAFIVWSKHF